MEHAATRPQKTERRVQSNLKGIGYRAEWVNLQQDRGRVAFIEKEEKEESRSSTSAVGSLIESCCAKATIVSTRGTGARRGSAITGVAAETLFGGMILTVSGSTEFDSAARSFGRTTRSASARMRKTTKVAKEGMVVINRGG
jgi:hypothetical protein